MNRTLHGSAHQKSVEDKRRSSQASMNQEVEKITEPKTDFALRRSSKFSDAKLSNA